MTIGGRRVALRAQLQLRVTVLLLLFSCLLQLASCSPPSTPPGSHFRSNPYEVLGVDASCTQKEIQRRYRTLCLEHHPDKKRSGEDTGNAGDGDDDFHFKEVQHAYSLIGTEEDRRNYDLMRKYTRYSSNQQDASSQYATTNDAFRQRNMNMFGGPSTIYFTFGDGLSFKVSSDRMHGMFRARRYGSPFGGADPRSRHQMSQHHGKPHYEQKLSVPLEVLYAGGKTVELKLRTSIIERYKAAYKGEMLVPILMQGALTVVLTWLRSQKVNWPLSIFLFSMMVHLNLPPPPAKVVFPTSIERGWKAGTKIKYSPPEADVTFVIEEGQHDTFHRVGDDLYTEVEVSARRLRKGCTLTIDPLCSSEAPIELNLKPNEVEHGQVVTVKSRGWPKIGSNKQECGDLQIKICRRTRR